MTTEESTALDKFEAQEADYCFRSCNHAHLARELERECDRLILASLEEFAMEHGRYPRVFGCDYDRYQVPVQVSRYHAYIESERELAAMYADVKL